MHYDVITIGGGLSGLTAAALLAKRGLHVAVIDKGQQPGGTCGVFKRGDTLFDVGGAMLYGFGEAGFNAHRFVMNCLEAPIDMIKHEMLYCVHFRGKRVMFYPDPERFAEHLGEIFPHEKEGIRRFYRDMTTMYRHVLVETPNYTTPDEMQPGPAVKGFLRHPISYLRFMSYLNRSAKDLLKKYFKDPEIFQFFDKMTSTYCYATVEEAPAILAAVMFVDNHVGGSYYPAGSTMWLPGTLEKVIEAHDGDMIMGREVTKILIKDGEAYGVRLDDDRELTAGDIVYSGTVWNLYGKLIDPEVSDPETREWAASMEPTYPSVVLYSVVDRAVIPEDTLPVEMMVGTPDKLDEEEVTAYISSIDDRTLCANDEHTVLAIGPSFRDWAPRGTEAYDRQKEEEIERLIGVLERRFPGFGEAVRYAELGTPRTIERYTMKNGGAVAGPKQMLGQHMFKRQHTRTDWAHLYCCGESTVMGTGTPTVTTSGLAAANAVLASRDLPIFVYEPERENHVRIVDHPYTEDQLYADDPEPMRHVKLEARRCRFCERPSCFSRQVVDMPGIMRRVAVDNLHGAARLIREAAADEAPDWEAGRSRCIIAREGGEGIDIPKVVDAVMHVKKEADA